MNSEKSDQTAQVSRLIWAFVDQDGAIYASCDLKKKKKKKKKKNLHITPTEPFKTIAEDNHLQKKKKKKMKRDNLCES